jgi:hypothetical protein
MRISAIVTNRATDLDRCRDAVAIPAGSIDGATGTNAIPHRRGSRWFLARSTL